MFVGESVQPPQTPPLLVLGVRAHASERAPWRSEAVPNLVSGQVLDLPLDLTRVGRWSRRQAAWNLQQQRYWERSTSKLARILSARRKYSTLTWRRSLPESVVQ